MATANFLFKGDIPASKSLMNRALLVQSQFPGVEIIGNSNCDDVRHMKMAIAAFIQKKNTIFCGEAGTVLRFMSLRCSREAGTFHLSGSERLMKRPQDDLVFLLDQLDVSCQLLPHELIIQSSGWKKPLAPIQVHRQSSSQFASGLLLNAWDLDFDLVFQMHAGVSEGYWQMSVMMAELLGMRIEKQGSIYTIPARQKPHFLKLVMEPDYSSAFAIAAAGALCGETTITNSTAQSIQPDFRFIKILRDMGVPVVANGSQLTVKKPREMTPIQINLESCPDLFPVLSVLCCFANGESKLFGAPHLIYKESNRIEKTKELLHGIHVHCTEKNDGISILGQGQERLNDSRAPRFVFNPDQDHRMAMAAGLLKLKGYEIDILQPQVVSKSYTDFWKVLGVKP